jgi:hypothetical protein
VAILDTGVQKSHPALLGKVISEACYSSNVPTQGASSLCPGGATSSTAQFRPELCGRHHRLRPRHPRGRHRRPCSPRRLAHSHPGLQPLYRQRQHHLLPERQPHQPLYALLHLRPGEGLESRLAVARYQQWYQRSRGQHEPGGWLPHRSLRSFGQYNNLRIAINQLRDVNVATVIAAGNSGYRNAMAAPACLTPAISVAASDKNDQVASFSNISSLTHLIAPGTPILAPVPTS